MLTGFKDRVALVTGGGGGIGGATAKLLAQLGAKVVVNDLFEERAKALAEEILSSGGEAFSYRADVTKEEEVSAMVGSVKERYGSLDILVNCAGVSSRKMLEEISLEEWSRILDINLTSTFLTCKAVVPIMKERGYGRIVNVSSLAGVTASLGPPHYAAAKGGVIAFTRKLAVELAPYGIIANAVAPALIETEMIKDRIESQGRKALEEMIPVRRLGRPEDVAYAIAFLCSEQASFIVGETLNINGGRYTK